MASKNEMTLEETLDEMRKQVVTVALTFHANYSVPWKCEMDNTPYYKNAPIRAFGNTPLEAATECLKRYKESVK